MSSVLLVIPLGITKPFRLSLSKVELVTKNFKVSPFKICTFLFAHLWERKATTHPVTLAGKLDSP